MSRVGNLPIALPKGVTFKIEDNLSVVTGHKGELMQLIPPEISVQQEESNIVVQRTGETKRHRSFHGLFRALFNNMVIGVSKGYQIDLEIQGVGYTAELKGKNLILNLGYSHMILFKPPEPITLEVPSRTQITIKGFDKQLVGEIAAKIRAFRPPEPYKGKGIRYVGEEVKRRVGKTAQ